MTINQSNQLNSTPCMSQPPTIYPFILVRATWLTAEKYDLWRRFVNRQVVGDVLLIVPCQLLPSDLLITQMEVTFSPLNRSRIKPSCLGHLEEPGGGFFKNHRLGFTLPKLNGLEPQNDDFRKPESPIPFGCPPHFSGEGSR